jgi:hypothetical protein
MKSIRNRITPLEFNSYSYYYDKVGTDMYEEAYLCRVTPLRILLELSYAAERTRLLEIQE